MDWLPDAIRDSHPRSFPWQESAPTRGVIHTTETVGWPGYNGWTVMPHATVMPLPKVGVEVRQHLPFSQGSFALVHGAGDVPTNGAHAFQFELIGTSDSSVKGMYFWPEADDAVLVSLYKKVIAPLSQAFGIPLVTPVWNSYPGSYGSTHARLTDDQWQKFHGWCGHEHVPQNVHGDPGAFPWARMMKLAAPSKPTVHGPVKYGDTGPSVQLIQKAVKVAVDGAFGRQTLIAVENFQVSHKLTKDGIVGPKTAAAMGYLYAAK